MRQWRGGGRIGRLSFSKIFISISWTRKLGDVEENVHGYM